MSSEMSDNYEPTYREIDVDKTLVEHDNRISRNEKRWLMGKGALAVLAVVKGIDFGIAQLGTLI